MRINAAQSILFALGVHFPLYSENKQGRRNATHTKKGPGRRHHTTEAEKVLRRSKRRDLANSDITLLRDNATLKYVSTHWHATRRGLWSLFMKSDKLYMRMLAGGPQQVVL